MHPRIQELSTFIRESRASLRDAIDSVPSDLRGRAPADGRWSVDGIVEHLSVVEGRIAATLRKKLDEARAAGIGQETETSPILPTLPIDRMIDRTTKINAPGVLTPTGITAEAAWSTLQGTRQQIETIMADADGVALREITHPHIAFGPLDLYTWFAFVGAHERRHAAQIREIGAELGASGRPASG